MLHVMVTAATAACPARHSSSSAPLLLSELDVGCRDTSKHKRALWIRIIVLQRWPRGASKPNQPTRKTRSLCHNRPNKAMVEIRRNILLLLRWKNLPLGSWHTSHLRSCTSSCTSFMTPTARRSARNAAPSSKLEWQEHNDIHTSHITDVDRANLLQPTMVLFLASTTTTTMFILTDFLTLDDDKSVVYVYSETRTKILFCIHQAPFPITGQVPSWGNGWISDLYISIRFFAVRVFRLCMSSM